MSAVSRRRWLPATVAATMTFSALSVPTALAQETPKSPVVINEVESNGDPVGDRVELANIDEVNSVDISGWSILDDDDDHTPIVFPEGTEIESGGYFSFYTDLEDDGFGLGGNDSVHLFDAESQLVEETTWEGHAATTWGRVPDMTGEFAVTGEPTRDATNIAEGETEPVADTEWPFDPQTIKDVDLGEEFAIEDFSGIDFDADGRAWVVNNDEGGLLALDYDVDSGSYTVAGQWNLKYPDGSGLPDTEGITVAEDGSLYVATERDNASKNVSRPSVLHFAAPTSEGGDLAAEQEWNLSEFTGEIGANSGLEAISALGGGEFAVGVEANGEVLFVDPSGDAPVLKQRYESPFEGVMALDYDAESGVLRALCDEVCEGASIELTQADGEWKAASEVQARPVGMDNVANEGFATHTFAGECTDGKQEETTVFLWADDGVTEGIPFRAAENTRTADCDGDQGQDDEQPSQSSGSSASSLSSLGGSSVGGILAAVVGIIAVVGGAMAFSKALPQQLLDLLPAQVRQFLG